MQHQHQGTSTPIECWKSERKDFFTQCVISLWNSLPQDVVMASDLDAFERGLDRFLEEKSNCRLQAMMGMYNFQALKEGTSKCQMQGRGIRRQVCSCLMCSQRHLVGPLWNTGSWTRWALGLIQQGSSYVLMFLLKK